MSIIKIGGILPNSLSNGRGTRLVIFFSGCNHKCPGCQNTHLWSCDAGIDMTLDDIKKAIEENLPIINGITLSGGEPFLQSSDAANIAEYAHSLGLDVWCYTGYEIYEIDTSNADNARLLNNIDVLVDGRYIKELPTDEKYKGSSNQNIIVMAKHFKIT